MSVDPFTLLCHDITRHDNNLAAYIEQEGYAALRQLIYSVREQLKTYSNDEIDNIEALIDNAERQIPNPSRYSPSWRNIWKELRSLANSKNKVLLAIPEAQREGEWQIVMHNPTLVQDVACYPGLTFLEAAFLYGYFQPELGKNEYIRFQKVTTLIVDYGE